MKIAVVILDWNSSEATRRVAAMVANWRIPACVPVIVDNGSEPPFPGEGLPPGAMLLRSERNRGFAGGVNLAVEALPAEEWAAILLLNGDASIDAESVARLSAMLADHPEVAVAGPILKEKTNSVTRRYAGGRDIARHIHTRMPLDANLDGPKDVDYVPGTACLIRRTALDGVGNMDEAFFFSGEVADFCRRIRKQGMRCVVVPGAVAEHHPVGDDPLRNELYAYYQLRNRFLYLRRAYAGALGWRGAGWVLVGLLMAVRALLGGRLRTTRALMLAVWDGLEGQFGDRHECFGY